MDYRLIRSIYWRLHTSYLTNRRTEARKFLGILADEVGGKGAAVLRAIGPIHMERFKRIKSGVESGSFDRIYDKGTSVGDSYVHCGAKKTGSEKRFCDEVMRDGNLSVLLTTMGVGDNSVTCRELVMGGYGRCDFLVRDGRKVHVVEVKMGDAPMDIVSQIDRYRLGAELDMCLGTHDEVFAYVLAEGFPQYVASELSRMDVEMIQHYGAPNKLRRVT